MVSLGRARTVANLSVVGALTIFLAACSSFNPGAPPRPAVAPQPAPVPEIPSTIRADELVGKWGLASYQNPADRDRTIKAAKIQCKDPYVIGAGTHGGVIMHLADEATPQELLLKGSRGGKNYIGPAGQPGIAADRVVLSFDGNVLITRFVDPDAGTRYGNMVYVRCPVAPVRHGRARRAAARR
ncbi:MAG: hypothetical protein ACREDC_10045 [Bradyrhizobium sp.]